MAHAEISDIEMG